MQDVDAADPISMRISDSIVDATDFEGTALGRPRALSQMSSWL